MKRSAASPRGTIGTALAAALLTLTACDHDPAGVADTAIEAESRSHEVSAELIASEMGRLADVLNATPRTRRLIASLDRLEGEAADPRGRPFAAAQRVLRAIDELAGTKDGAAIAPELDALRLLLDALQFDEPGAALDAPAPRLAIW